MTSEAAPSSVRAVLLAPPDSATLSAAAQAADLGQAPVLSSTELLLQDLGADAVAEVTQKPEPAPDSEATEEMIR